MSQIILASASPRRRELLEQIGLNFEVCPAKGEEIIIKKEPKEVGHGTCSTEGERSRIHVKNIWR